MGVLIGLFCLALLWSMLASGCHKESGEAILDPVDPVDTADRPTIDTLDFPDDCPPPPNRDTLDCPEHPGYILLIIAERLLSNPVYSPRDNCVYYEDSGVDSAYYVDFIHSVGGVPSPRVVQPGIYRLRIDDDSPAELVAPWGRSPSITPDGATLYYIFGYIEALDMSWPSGPIMKKQLPDGELGLVSERHCYRACWYSPDTLVVNRVPLNFLDLETDSLHYIGNGMYNVDVMTDSRIIGDFLKIYDPKDFSVAMIIQCEDCRHCRRSPDGTETVYAFDDGIGSQIRITDFAGNQRILAIGGGADYPCLGRVKDPAFAGDGEYVIYIRDATPINHDYHHPCGWNSNPIYDGQIWIMSAIDGSGKRQVSTWSRIRP